MVIGSITAVLGTGGDEAWKKKIIFMRSLLNFFSIEADGASLAMYCSNVLRLGYEYKMHKRIVNKRIQTRAVHLALWL